MDLTLSEDQRAIVSSVAAILADVMPSSRRRDLAELGDAADGHDEGLDRFWATAAEQGWFGLGLEERHGGTGYGLVEEMLAFKEIGRHLAPGPLAATVLGARTAALSGRADLAEDLLAGRARVGLATAAEPDGPSLPALRGMFTLTDAVAADHLLVLGPDQAAVVPVAVVTGRRNAHSLDESVRRETGRIDATADVVVDATTDRITARYDVLISAILVGIAEATRDMAVEYAKTRVQFDSPIGAFQTIKHRCADMAIGAATADAQLLFAALSLDAGEPDAAYQVAAACVVAARAAMWNARENIQVHGGMGFTWECDAHFYLKRVHLMTSSSAGLARQRQVLVQR